MTSDACKPNLANVRLVELPPREVGPEPAPQPAPLPRGKPFPSWCELTASAATIRIIEGRHMLAEHFEQPGKTVLYVPVVINAVIMEPIDQGGKHSQPFRLFVRSIEHEGKFYAKYPDPHDEFLEDD